MKLPSLLAALALPALAAFTVQAQTVTLVHQFDFTTDAASRVGGLTTATGTLSGGASISGGSLHLTGDAWVDLAPVVPVAGDYNASTWTVSIWARSLMPAGQTGELLSQGAYTGYLPDFDLGLSTNADGSAGAFARNRSGWGGGASGSVADAGGWNLYTTVMSHFGAVLYVNGVFQGSGGNSMYPCCYTSQTARIGRAVANFGGQFAGEIDDVRIYTGSLSQSAIMAQYAAGPSAVSAVPEPEPAPMLMLGLGGLALWLQRRRIPR